MAWVHTQAANTGTDPAHKYAWGENVGWANAGPTNREVTVHYEEGAGGWLSGRLWAENIGWIVMGRAGGGPYENTTAENWGVNLDADGKLTGYAWGENVGWFHFEQTHGQPAIDPVHGEFSGYVWGENVGWGSFRGVEPEYGVRSLAFDTQPKGAPNWWLANYGVEEDYNAGDGVPASDKYVMDVDPTVPGNALRITSISPRDGEVDVAFAPASTRRYYTLCRREDLTTGSWIDVVGPVATPGRGGIETLKDTNAAPRAFYSVRVTVTP